MAPSFENSTLKSQHQRLLTLLTEQSYQQREVVLSSGKKSNFYIDCKQTTLHSEGHFLVGQLYRAIVEKVAPQAEAVGGMSMGGDPLASATSLVSFIAGKPLHAFYVRKEAKGHGTGRQVEGGLPEDARVIIIEDAVTSGGSALRAIEAIRQHGATSVGVLCLIDRHQHRDLRIST